MPGWVAAHHADLVTLFDRLGLGDPGALLPSTYTRAAVAVGCMLLVFLTVTAGVVRWRDSLTWRRLFEGLLGVFFLHGFTHVGHSIAFRDYTPGVISAVLVVIPVSAFVYRRLLARGSIDPREAAVATGVAALLFVPAAIMAMSVAAWLTGR
jgi:hypothetical protein